LKKLIATFHQTKEAAQNGIFLGNKKYFFLRSTEDTIYGKLASFCRWFHYYI